MVYLVLQQNNHPLGNVYVTILLNRDFEIRRILKSLFYFLYNQIKTIHDVVLCIDQIAEL